MKSSLNIRDKIFPCLFGLFLALTVSTTGWSKEDHPFFERYLTLLKRHKLVKAAEADIEGARQRIQSTVGGWYPQLNLSSFYGKEKQNNFATEDTLLVAREFGITITQLLWDFGVVNSQIRRRNFNWSKFSHN